MSHKNQYGRHRRPHRKQRSTHWGCSYSRRLRIESLEDRRVLTVFVVDSVADAGVGTLRHAIELANNSAGLDTITFDPVLFSSPQTIAIASQLPTIADDLAILGPGETLLTIDAGNGVDGKHATRDGYRHLLIDDGDEATSIAVEVHGLTLMGGDVHPNDQHGQGGAIRNKEQLFLDGINVKDSAANFGGGIASVSGSIWIANSTLAKNSARFRGGGLYSVTTSTISKSDVLENMAGDSGGGVCLGDSTTISDSTIARNAATQDGGGVYASHGVSDIKGTTVAENSATRGGGVFWDSIDSALITNSSLVGNAASSSGGGIYSSVIGVSAIESSTLSQNSAPAGGAIYASYGTVAISRSTLSQNSATNGGGIYKYGHSAIDVENSTLSANTASNDGGGIYVAQDSTVFPNRPATIIGSTLAENESYRGSGIYSLGMTVVSGSIVSSASGSDLVATASATLSGSHNLIEDGSHIAKFSDSVTGDPLLGPLSDNGGPTLTHAILPNSLAINRGDPGREFDDAEFDQRGEGFTRVQRGRIDIGAVESSELPPVLPTPSVVTVADEGLDGDWSVEDISLAEAIVLANLNPGPDEITFDTAVFSTPQVIHLAKQLPTVTDELIISGPGADLLIIDAGYGLDGVHNTRDGHRHFLIDNGDASSTMEVKISGLALRGGDTNYFDERGGAILSREHVTVSGVVMVGNSAVRGGAVFIDAGEFTLIESTLSENAAFDGGAINVSVGTALYVIGSLLTTNTARNWGGAILNSGVATIRNSTIASNSTNVGGGVFSSGGTTTISDSTIANNSSAAGGGFLNSNGVATISRSTFWGNSVVQDGGGVGSSGALTVTESTFSGNHAGVRGGGIHIASGVATINGVTVSNNAAGIGGGISSPSAVATVTGSIIANSTSGGDLDGNFAGIYNLVGDGHLLSRFTNSLQGDPSLGPLADNGGATLTHAPLAGSIVINHGDPTVAFDPIEFDQRGEGFARAANGRVDMGAVESSLPFVEFPSSLVVTSLDGGIDGDWSADDLSLAEAMVVANFTSGAEIISFDPVIFESPQTILLSQQLPTIIGALSVIGPGASLLKIDAGNGIDGVFGTSDGVRHFLIDDGDEESLVDVSISGVTLTGGDPLTGGGGAVLNRENLHLAGSTIAGNRAVAGGGLASYGAVTVNQSIFRSNSAGSGGALTVVEGTATIDDTTIFENVATSGGGIFNRAVTTITGSTVSNNIATNGGGIYNFGSVTVENSEVSANSAQSNGGGIQVPGGQTSWDGPANVVVINSVISNNTASNTGGGINMVSGTYYRGVLTVHGSTLSGNSAGTDGGGVWIYNSTATIDHSTMSHNSAAEQGGGIYSSNLSGLTVTSSSLTYNVATTQDGGGVYNTSGSVAVLSSTVAHNRAARNGGGIATSSGKLEVKGSTFSQNLAGTGGGLHAASLGVTVVDSTFSANSATSKGGGAHYSQSSGSFIINTSTWSGNSAPTGGGISIDRGLLTINSSIVANSPTGGDISGTTNSIFSGSYNLIGDASYLPKFTHSFAGNPGLEPLADNGGATYTHALLPGSLAINAGDSLVAFDPAKFDQRGDGFVRVIDGIMDIGSFESNQPPPDEPAWPIVVVTSLDGGINGNWTAGDLSLAEAITLANAHAGADTIIFDPALFSSPQTILLGETLPTVRDHLYIVGPGAALLILDAGHGLDGVHATADGFRHFKIDDGNSASVIQVEISGVTLTGGDVKSSESIPNGGAIATYEDLTLHEVAIRENAARRGGGVFIGRGPTKISRSTLSSNKASEGGGAVSNDRDGVLTVTDSTLSANNASSGGGGISNASGRVTVVRSTIYNNSGFRGDGISNTGGAVTLTGSIVSSDHLSAALYNNSGTYSGSYNLLGEADLLDDFTNSKAGNPGLGPLADNGGPTHTHAVLAGSLVINAGDPGTAFDPTEFDQRGVGFPRVIGGTIDIGAFESDQAPPDVPAWPNIVVSSIEDGFNGNWLAGDISLAEAIVLANEHSGSDHITFAPLVFATSQRILLTRQLPTISDALTITGPGAELLTLDGGNGRDGVFGTGDGFRTFVIDDGSSINKIQVEISDLELTGADFSEGYGGAIHNRENLNLRSSILTGNFAKSGGGIGNYYGVLTIEASTLTANAATSGGGVYNYVATATLSGVTLSGNIVTDSGGGASNYDGTITINSSTFSANSAKRGGGVYSFDSQTTLSSSTLAGNTASELGGAVYLNHGSVTLSNSIVAGFSTGGSLARGSGAFSGSFNILEDGSFLQSFGNSFAFNPRLAPLADNGGQTLTHALLPGSLAINRGDPAVQFGPDQFDQRGSGFSRVQQGRLDIGAFESELQPPSFPSPLQVTVTDDGLNDDWSAGDLSLAEAIVAANLTPGHQEITFDPNLFATPRTIRLANQLPVITESVTIAGPGVGLLVIDAGNGTDGVFNTRDGLRHFVIDNGNASSVSEVRISDLTLTGGDVRSSDLLGRGGAIWNNENLQLFGVTIDANAAIDGGGVYNAASALITSSTISRNVAATRGGGVYNALVTAQINATTIVGNSATSGGGAYTEVGLLAIRGSTLSANSANNGGGVYSETGSIVINSSTLSANAASVNGGAIYDRYGRGRVSNSTLWKNSATSGGGIFNLLGGTSVTNSIVAGSVSGGDLRGWFTGSYNLIGDASHVVYFTNSISADPLLGPLADHGGATLTHGLLPGSPALDAGDPLFNPTATTPAVESDQRGAGYGRVVNAGGGLRIDIGAYESQGMPVAFPSGDYNHDGIANLADYVVWRDTLGSTTDLRANGYNLGASENVIDQADYAIWNQNFGNTVIPTTPAPVAAMVSEAAFAAYVPPDAYTDSEKRTLPTTSTVRPSLSERYLLLLLRENGAIAAPESVESERPQDQRSTSEISAKLSDLLAMVFDNWL